jgi:hypothetical protein
MPLNTDYPGKPVPTDHVQLKGQSGILHIWRLGRGFGMFGKF